MKNIPEADDGAAANHLPKTTERHANDMRRLNEGIVKVIELLNRDVEMSGINQYETLRRIVRDDERLKGVYRGVVNPSKIINDVARIFAMQATSEAEGGRKLEDVLKESSPQQVFDKIVKDILPAVITNHVQDYMAGDRTHLR